MFSNDLRDVCHCLQPYAAHFDGNGNFNYICPTYTPFCRQETINLFLGVDQMGNPNIRPNDEFDIHRGDSGGYKICRRVPKSISNPRCQQIWAHFSTFASAEKMLQLVKTRQAELMYELTGAVG